MEIDASKYDYQQLNSLIRDAKSDCVINNCLGQRFIGCGMSDISITVNGTPGNAIGAYLDGAEITVNGNAQDAVGDTMNAGKIIIHGNAGDAVGYAMRGGEIYIEKNAGYRAGIHMKAYRDKLPVMVIGGSSGSFLGEYLAGGLIIVLGIGCEGRAVSNFPGTGMHGGKMLLRGNYENLVLPKQVKISVAKKEELDGVRHHIETFCELFGYDIDEIMSEQFCVLTPNTSNPYKQMYVAN